MNIQKLSFLKDLSTAFKRDLNIGQSVNSYLVNGRSLIWMSLISSSFVITLNSCTTSKTNSNTFPNCSKLLEALRKEWSGLKIQVGEDFTEPLEDGGSFYQAQTNYGTLGYLLSSPHLAKQFAKENPRHRLEAVGICWKEEDPTLVWRLSSYSLNPAQ